MVLPFHCAISNFEKKYYSIVNKRIFLPKFLQLYVFRIWFNRSDKSSIADVQLGSRYASVNITLHLTFFKIT